MVQKEKEFNSFYFITNFFMLKLDLKITCLANIPKFTKIFNITNITF